MSVVGQRLFGVRSAKRRIISAIAAVATVGSLLAFTTASAQAGTSPVSVNVTGGLTSGTAITVPTSPNSTAFSEGSVFGIVPVTFSGNPGDGGVSDYGVQVHVSGLPSNCWGGGYQSHTINNSGQQVTIAGNSAYFTALDSAFAISCSPSATLGATSATLTFTISGQTVAQTPTVYLNIVTPGFSLLSGANGSSAAHPITVDASGTYDFDITYSDLTDPAGDTFSGVLGLTDGCTVQTPLGFAGSHLGVLAGSSNPPTLTGLGEISACDLSTIGTSAFSLDVVVSITGGADVGNYHMTVWVKAASSGGGGGGGTGGGGSGGGNSGGTPGTASSLDPAKKTLTVTAPTSDGSFIPAVLNPLTTDTQAPSGFAWTTSGQSGSWLWSESASSSHTTCGFGATHTTTAYGSAPTIGCPKATPGDTVTVTGTYVVRASGAVSAWGQATKTYTIPADNTVPTTLSFSVAGQTTSPAYVCAGSNVQAVAQVTYTDTAGNTADAAAAKGAAGLPITFTGTPQSGKTVVKSAKDVAVGAHPTGGAVFTIPASLTALGWVASVATFDKFEAPTPSASFSLNTTALARQFAGCTPKFGAATYSPDGDVSNTAVTAYTGVPLTVTGFVAHPAASGAYGADLTDTTDWQPYAGLSVQLVQTLTYDKSGASKVQAVTLAKGTVGQDGTYSLSYTPTSVPAAPSGYTLSSDTIAVTTPASPVTGPATSSTPMAYTIAQSTAPTFSNVVNAAYDDTEFSFFTGAASGIKGKLLTGENNPVVGSTVTAKVGSTVLGTAKTDADGNFDLEFTAKAASTSGVSLTASTVKGVPPLASPDALANSSVSLRQEATASGVTPSTASAGANITVTGTVLFNNDLNGSQVTAPKGVTIQIVSGSTVVASGTTSASGTFSIVIPKAKATAGSFDVKIKAGSTWGATTLGTVTVS